MLLEKKLVLILFSAPSHHCPIARSLSPLFRSDQFTKMTTYGTILSETPLSSERIKSRLGTRKPWSQMFKLQSFCLPSSFTSSISRIGTNALIFRENYAIIILMTLFLSLLWHPISLIVFTVMMVAWLSLYFLREDPLIIFGLTIHDMIVMMVLLLVTILLLFLTNVTDNILASLFVGLVVVLVHGVLRSIDDLILEEADEERLGSVAAVSLRGTNHATPPTPMVHVASPSFSKD